MPLEAAVSLLADAVVSASRRGVPLVGMRLDYDLTMVETQAVQLCGRGIVERGWCGPVLDAGVIDRHFDPDRRGRRTLGDLCGQYGIEIERAHDASVDAIASLEVLFALASRYDALRESDLVRLHDDQICWHREWGRGVRRVAALAGHDPDRPAGLRVAARPGKPVARCLIPLRP